MDKLRIGTIIEKAGWGFTILFALIAVVSIAGCRAVIPLPANPVLAPTQTNTPFQPEASSAAFPTPTDVWTPLPEPTATQTLQAPSGASIWAKAALPDGMRSAAVLPAGWRWSADSAGAALTLSLDPQGEIAWVYALAVPFPRTVDEMSLDEIMRAWQGEPGAKLWMTGNTREVFSALWGAPAQGAVETAGEADLIDQVWADPNARVLLPFEALEPRWKVLRVNGQSPFDRGGLDGYALTVRFHIEGDQTPFSTKGGSLLSTNRDPNKMTVVLMTGTTALVRAVGWRMEGNGMTYPGEDVLPWFQSADFRHISNESSFNLACPNANPVQDSLMFCSRPEYIRLLDALGVNVVELSGNHNNDWGREASTYSLSLYNERGWGVFAGGANLNEAVQPLQIEHNGNRIAFLGCNKAGPPAAWATESEPGAAPCDFEALGAQIRSLRDEGVLPIVTFQHNEVYVPTPGEAQRRDFLWAADQGAVVVSGSQAHFPQGFAFENGALVHFGLGNLFFDQMDIPVVGTRREFLDRHVFYNGRYVGTELLTAMLEDYARPRPMTAAEREPFLEEIFSASGW